MKPETIENILNFLEEKEDKQIPSKWELIKKIENHPDGIQYRYEGDLVLRHTNITKLPNNLYVDGVLDLYGCKRLTKLPDNLYVGGYFSIEETNIEELPDNLYVDHNLYLDNTNIANIPNNLYVGKNLFIKDTPLAKKYQYERFEYMDEDIHKIVASTGGEIVGKIIR